ncbi:MAG: urease subunit beta [Nitrospiraceae bacterium]
MATKATKSRARKKAVTRKRPTLAPSAGQRSVAVVPGEILLAEGDVIALHGKQTIEITVANIGDRPIQVGSHCHFFEANRALRFDREQAYGFRLQVPAGTAVRFEPGEEKRVTLVAFGGKRVAYGINGLTNGKLDDPEVRARALAKARELGFLGDQVSR